MIKLLRALTLATVLSGCGSIMGVCEYSPKNFPYFYEGVKYSAGWLRIGSGAGPWEKFGLLLDLPFTVTADTALLFILNLPLGG